MAKKRITYNDGYDTEPVETTDDLKTPPTSDVCDLKDEVLLTRATSSLVTTPGLSVTKSPLETSKSLIGLSAFSSPTLFPALNAFPNSFQQFPSLLQPRTQSQWPMLSTWPTTKTKTELNTSQDTNNVKFPSVQNLTTTGTVHIEEQKIDLTQADSNPNIAPAQVEITPIKSSPKKEHVQQATLITTSQKKETVQPNPTPSQTTFLKKVRTKTCNSHHIQDILQLKVVCEDPLLKACIVKHQHSFKNNCCKLYKGLQIINEVYEQDRNNATNDSKQNISFLFQLGIVLLLGICTQLTINRL